jgi:3-hydroxyisobutyrate dehydrogenase-like beta-hydroxyacid dehydrogenase
VGGGGATHGWSRVKVGFVGLGDQGLPMAERSAAAGPDLHVWARRRESAEPLAGVATVCATVGELGTCDVVGICVRSDDDVRQVLVGPDGIVSGLAAGTVVAIHSTVLPQTCRQLEPSVIDAGGSLLDAPVSGGRGGAKAGTLSIMVGGDADAFARAAPVFASFGTPLHLGPLGSGQLMKLLNNAALFANMRVTQVVLDAAGAMGLDREATIEALTRGSGASASLPSFLRMLVRPDLSAVVELLAKDLDHFDDVASAPLLSTLGREAVATLARHAAANDASDVSSA